MLAQLRVIEGGSGHENPPIGRNIPSIEGIEEEPSGANATHVSHLNASDPPPPDTIPADMHPAWFALIADLRARKRLTDAVLPIARTYIVALWMAHEAEKAIAEKGVFVTGAANQIKSNPAIGLLRQSQGTIARLAGELGITGRGKIPLKDAPQSDMFAAFDL